MSSTLVVVLLHYEEQCMYVYSALQCMYIYTLCKTPYPWTYKHLLKQSHSFYVNRYHWLSRQVYQDEPHTKIQIYAF